jgi:hypothetical protein
MGKGTMAYTLKNLMEQGIDLGQMNQDIQEPEEDKGKEKDNKRSLLTDIYCLITHLVCWPIFH